MEKLLRGSVVSDFMLINLRLYERKETLLTFLQLLKEIRAEEVYEASHNQSICGRLSIGTAGR